MSTWSYTETTVIGQVRVVDLSRTAVSAVPCLLQWDEVGRAVEDLAHEHPLRIRFT